VNATHRPVPAGFYVDDVYLEGVSGPRSFNVDWPRLGIGTRALFLDCLKVVILAAQQAHKSVFGEQRDFFAGFCLRNRFTVTAKHMAVIAFWIDYTHNSPP